MSKINIISANVRGNLSDREYAVTLLTRIKDEKADLIMFQETKLTQTDEKYWNKIFGSFGKTWFCHGSSQSKGTLITISHKLYNNNVTQIEYPTPSSSNLKGRVIALNLQLNDIKIIIICGYAPNGGSKKEDQEMYDEFCNITDSCIGDIDGKNTIVIAGGDFNLIRDPRFDAIGGAKTMYPVQLSRLHTFMNSNLLCDIHR